ncbi:GST-like protein [Sphingomonas sp. EC-HK361]|uniref:MAPEG family protein n=1 Tax=Sphingomonas sp. EC-HK361 TaxID=2038397 RepID=UPI00125238C0|nr:MAPEG family protein [Sphingomonas sp. EC-HK361]VVT06587.1 GST-like protein [Sphingomonas sp. EC-HK361]
MSTVLLPITLVSAGAMALVNVWLGYRVGQVRTAEKVSVGDGGNERVIRRMRAHANFAEYAPFVLALVGLIEFTSGTSTWLAVVAGLFVVARIVHGIGMDGRGQGRTIGTIVTLLTLAGLGLYAIVLPLIADRGSVPSAPVPPALARG